MAFIHKESIKLVPEKSKFDEKFIYGNTGFWAIYRENEHDGYPAWELNFTPEGNRDSNVDQKKKALYKALYVLGLQELYVFSKKNTQDENHILVLPHTNYTFFRHTQKVVEECNPSAELNHVELESDFTDDPIYKKHRYVLDLGMLCESENFKQLLQEKRTFITQLQNENYQLEFEYDD